MTSNKKIAIFLSNLNGGGAERAMVILANEFAKLKYQVHLVLFDKKGVYLNEVDEAVEIITLNINRMRMAIPALAKYLKKEQPDALLSCLTHTNSIAILTKIFFYSKIHLVISERSTISQRSMYVNGITNTILFKLPKFLYKKANAICTVSQGAATDLAKYINLPRERITTIYNPFQLENIKKLSNEELKHPWFNEEKKTKKMILAVGRLAEVKNHSLLLRAFAILKQKTAVRLLILGEGELRKDLEALTTELRLCEDDIQMPGFVQNPYPYMAKCDVFVLTSLYEGLPGVLIQAMVCGAPIVSTDCPSGPREILEDGKWGRLVVNDSIPDLVNALYEVLSAPKDLLPNVMLRANDFEAFHSVKAYLKLLNV